jgi:hypothetical protein
VKDIFPRGGNEGLSFLQFALKLLRYFLYSEFVEPAAIEGEDIEEGSELAVTRAEKRKELIARLRGRSSVSMRKDCWSFFERLFVDEFILSRTIGKRHFFAESQPIQLNDAVQALVLNVLGMSISLLTRRV